MGPIVRVVGNPGSITVLGGGRFGLRARAGRYALPQLELRPSTPGRRLKVHSVRIAGVTAPNDAIAAAIEAAWSASNLAGLAVTAPTRSAPCTLDTGAFATADGPLDAAVDWVFTCTDPSNGHEENEVTVELRFEPAAGAPADQNGHLGFVAIDIGTTNSTVTLFDQQRLNVRALATAQTTRLRADLLTVLGGGSPAAGEPLPAGHEAALTELVERVADAALPADAPADGTGLARLTAALIKEPVGPRDPVLLHTVLRQVESQRSACPERELKRWLTRCLHVCYDRAFDVPALDRLQLFPVELHSASGRFELSSRVEVTTADPLSVRMGAELEDGRRTADGAARDAPARSVIPDLKKHLARTEPRTVHDGAGGSADVTTDDLIREALGFLVQRSQAFVDSDRGGDGRGRLRRAVVTYPTVAPPAVRDRLRALVGAHPSPGIDHVGMDYDEAVAAVMFFLMRDLGGEITHVAEAVRARYRRVGEGAWAQNVLVIDIGGGTTDIALVTMTLRDETGHVPDADERWLGRYYTLTPQVRGTTGHLQLGGEYLTLQVFRWIKAVVADAALVATPEPFRTPLASLPEDYRDEGGGYRPGSLLEGVLGRGSDTDAVLGWVDRVLPTTWPPGVADPRREQAFWGLWQLAEEAKIAFGREVGAPPFRIDGARLRAIVEAVVDLPDNPDLGAAFGDVEVPSAPFDALVREPLEHVMRLATDLALDRLHGQPLDRIVLTGRTSAMDHVRRALHTRFGQVDGRQERVKWSAGGVLVEEEFPKLATSIGAAWAESLKKTRFESRATALPQMRTGISQLRIEIRNLFFTLPCSFGLRRDNSTYEPLIPAGRDLLQIDSAPVGKARSDEWRPLTAFFDVYRMLAADDGIIWSSFQYDTYGQVLDRSVWPVEINVEIEVTQTLDLYVHVCRGDPDHVASGPARDVREAVAKIAARLGISPPFDEHGALTGLPGDLVVDPRSGGSGEVGGEPAFRATIASDPDGSMFGRRVFADDDEPDELARRVAVSAPLPEGGQSWEFYLRSPDGESLEYVGSLDRPARDDDSFPTTYRATLDTAGALRVHAGELPYRRANDLRDVQDRPGRVHRIKMESREPLLDPTRDPFNGTH